MNELTCWSPLPKPCVLVYPSGKFGASDTGGNDSLYETDCIGNAYVIYDEYDLKRCKEVFAQDLSEGVVIREITFTSGEIVIMVRM